MILVTGPGGVLGSALVARLAEGAEPVVALSSADIDLRDRDACIGVIRRHAPRLIFHLAGKVHGLGGNSRFPAEMFSDNVRINTNVVEAAVEAGCEKIVAASTVAIYSSDAPKPSSEGSIWLGPPHHSEAAYAHAKRAMLGHLEACRAQYGLRFAYPVLTNLYGAHDRFDEVNGHVVPSLIAKFHASRNSGEPVYVWGTGRAQRDFIHADDAARALSLVADRHEGPINVASGEIRAIGDVVACLAAHSGVTDVRWDRGKPDGQLQRSYDVSALRQIGFTNTTSLSEGLSRTFDWYDAHFPDVRR